MGFEQRFGDVEDAFWAALWLPLGALGGQSYGMLIHRP